MKKLITVPVYHGQVIQDDTVVYDILLGEKDCVQSALRASLSMTTGEYTYTEDTGEIKAAKWKITEIPVKVIIDVPDEPHEYMLRHGVFMSGFGLNKISVIKCVREHTGMDLKGAKDLVESATTDSPARIPDVFGIGFINLRHHLVDAGVPYDDVWIR